MKAENNVSCSARNITIIVFVLLYTFEFVLADEFLPGLLVTFTIVFVLLYTFEFVLTDEFLPGLLVTFSNEPS